MSTDDNTYSEKRDFIRMRINSPVDISLAGKTYRGTCKDLSGAGMLVETEQAFDIGAKVDISIDQDNDKHLPFNAKAEVSRITEGESNNYIVGLIIKEIAE